MTSYEFWSLFVSIFVAIGTCGATVLALYFGLNDKRIKLDCCVMEEAYGFGSILSVEGAYLVVRLTNRNVYPITITCAGFAIYERKYFMKKRCPVVLFRNTQFDSLPKKIEFGDSYLYAVLMDEVHPLFCHNKVADVKIVVCISVARRDIYFKLDKKIKMALHIQNLKT